MAKRDFRPKPLYRKVNTRTHGVSHATGPDYRHLRNTKAETRNEATRGKMVQGARRGLDYTPLYRFLLKKVGQPWDEVYREAVARLDRSEAIWHLVAQDPGEGRPVVRTSESTYYSGLYVDGAGLLQRVAPEVTLADLWPLCSCCTHTFNGALFVNAYDPEVRTLFSGPAPSPG